MAQETGIPKWVALGSGNMDRNLRESSGLILSHTHLVRSSPLISQPSKWSQPWRVIAQLAFSTYFHLLKKMFVIFACWFLDGNRFQLLEIFVCFFGFPGDLSKWRE